MLEYNLFVGHELCSRLILGRCQKNSAALSLPKYQHDKFIALASYKHITLILGQFCSGETIYPARCGPVGKEEPKYSCLPKTQETQVKCPLPKSKKCFPSKANFGQAFKKSRGFFLAFFGSLSPVHTPPGSNQLML